MNDSQNPWVSGPRLVALLLLVAICVGSGCSQTVRIPYETEITIRPTADAEGADAVARTEVLHRREVELKTRPSWYSYAGMIAGYTGLGVITLGYTSILIHYQTGSLDELPSGRAFVGIPLPFAVLAVGSHLTRHRFGRTEMMSTDGAFNGRIELGKQRDLSLDEMIMEIPAPTVTRDDGEQGTVEYRHMVARTGLPSHSFSRSDTSEAPLGEAHVRRPIGPQRPVVQHGVMGAPHQAQPALAQGGAKAPQQAQSVAGLGGLRLVTGAPQPNAYAFVVGIEEYRSVTNTPGARTDAQRFAAMLEFTLGVPEQNIHLLTDAEATRSDILATLSWLERNVSADGRIYFFFSGHGSPNVETGESYLLPYEGQPETIEHSGISLQEILDGLQQTPARDVLAFVDACFSGSGDRSALPAGARPLVPVQEAKPQSGSNLAFFASSGAAEISGTSVDGDEGLFTHHLLRALGEGRADIDGDGMINIDELHTYLAPRVARDARRLNREQTPTFSVSDGLGSPESVILLWGLPRN